MDAMPTTRRRCQQAAAAAIVAATAATATAAIGTGTSYAVTGSSYLGVLNQERASRGIAPLQLNTDLTRVAHSWAEEMASTGVLRHNPRLESEVPNWWSVGENVGDGATMGSLAQAFWNSPEHRANILDAHFTQVGISAVRDDGRIWIAVVFRQPWHHATATSAPQQQRASTTSQEAYPGRLLMRGTVSPAVAFVQKLLGLQPDGIFGPLTQQAVAAFQRRQHLVVDAIVGPITWSALLRVH